MSFDLSVEETAAAVGPWATASEAYGLLTVDVPAEHWIEALIVCRDGLGLAYLDWLSAVDELADGFSVCAHLVHAGRGPAQHVLLRTRVPRDAAVLPTAFSVFAGAAWHERETHEMFGIGFEGHPHLVPLLLPDGFEGHPLRKDFVLAARVAKAWPGAKEPGESDHAPAEGARRRMLPPGVPDPNEWGPLKGTLPPAPERPARGARAAGAGGPAADRPRRTRSAAAGSASQPPAAPAADSGAAPASETPTAPASSPDMPWQSPEPGTPGTPTARPRRSRSVSEGSVSQPAAAAAPDAREAATGSERATAGGEPAAEAAEPAAPEAPSAPQADESQAVPEGDVSRSAEAPAEASARETPAASGEAAEAPAPAEPEKTADPQAADRDAASPEEGA